MHLKKLLIIDNKFFGILPSVEYFIDSFLNNLSSENYKKLFGEDTAIAYINNGDEKYDEKYKKNTVIYKSLSEIDLNACDIVLYSNIPFFVINNSIFEQIVSQKLDSNKIYTQEGYNLFFKNIPNRKRFLFSKSKVNQSCNISNILLYMFKPESLDAYDTQTDLLKKLHKNSPQVILEFANTGTFQNSSLFLNEDDYINTCIENIDEIDTIGNYIITYNNESTNFKLTDFYSFVEKLSMDNPKCTFELKSILNIGEYFSENITEDGNGELIVTTNYKGDISKINISAKESFYYDGGSINSVLNLDDYSARYFLTSKAPKFIKIYNKKYNSLYKISKSDLENANTIGIKRTMGMGDALLALVFGYKIYKIYNKKINFYSQYNFSKYLKEDFIENYYPIDNSHIFREVENGEDIFIDFDLAYENQCDGESFYYYYSQLFEDDALDFDNRNDVILKSTNLGGNMAVLNGEGSGWGGKEISMGLLDDIGRTLKEKGFLVAEVGRNRISHYADITNPEESLDVLFDTIGKSKFYIGVDSGQLHIANLMGKPCYAFGGAISPMKSQYNTDIVWEIGNTQLLCYSCRSYFKGTRATSDGNITFVPACTNEKQYECMQFNSGDVLNSVNDFLIKYELA
jgi:hypothetical protein